MISVEPDIHRTSVLATVELTQGDATSEEDFSFIVSCDSQLHTPAPDCPLWLRRGAPAE